MLEGVEKLFAEYRALIEKQQTEIEKLKREIEALRWALSVRNPTP